MSAQGFTIPSIFTAINKFSAPLKGMGKDIDNFVQKSQVAVLKSESAFKNFLPSISSVGKELLQFLSTATLIASVVAGISFSTKSFTEYQDSVAQFRTIVSDLSNKDFAKYQNEINKVAKDTKESSITVAKSFEMIAGLNADLAKTSDGLGEVSKAAITLSQASKDDLGKSASNLVGIMNQFNLAANQSNRVINVLAAGQAVGASSIIQTADAFTIFGAVADSSNLSLEQSVALTEVLASKQIKGSEAGTALRGTLIRLKSAGYGYASGLFNTRDALSEVKAEFDKLKTAKEKDALLDKVFGTINMTTGTILMNNIQLYDEFTKKVTGTSEAHKAAEINTNTFSKTLERLSNKWVNLITSSNNVSAILSGVNNIIIFLTDHMEEIVTVGALVIGFFIGWYAWILATKLALLAMSAVSSALFLVEMVKYVAATRGLTIMQAIWAITTESCTAAMASLNAMIMANPIGLMVLAILALIGVVIAIIKYWNDWGATIAFIFSFFMPGLFLIISLVQSFRRNWEMVKKAFTAEGMIGGLKAIGKVILDVILMPMQQMYSLIAKFTGAKWATEMNEGIENFRKELGVNVETDESGDPLPGKELVNPKAIEQESLVQKIETQKQNVAIDINDNTGRAKVNSDNNIIPIKLTSTVGFSNR